MPVRRHRLTLCHLQSSARRLPTNLPAARLASSLLIVDSNMYRTALASLVGLLALLALACDSQGPSSGNGGPLDDNPESCPEVQPHDYETQTCTPGGDDDVCRYEDADGCIITWTCT